MVDRLAPYRGKRDPARTPEPVPAASPAPSGGDDTFVIQEHHARRLHWDFRLERGGVLVSWAIPKGLPTDPRRNHLAVQTEDHPLEYATFAGMIPRGEYGGGTVQIWDRGRYDCEKWTDREVKVVLHGERARGRFVLIHTNGKNWLIHRMDPPEAPPGREPLPELVRPMLATPGGLPSDQDGAFGYEMRWAGVRAVVYVGGVQGTRVLTGDSVDVTANHPELAGLAQALAGTPAVLDGVIVMATPDAATYRIVDLLHFDGYATIGLPYRQRRELLESLRLHAPHWDTLPYATGGGEQALAAAAAGLTGVVAKRLDSAYEPGRRSSAWIAVMLASGT